MTASNGARITYWIIGALFSVLVLTFSGMASSFNERMTVSEAKQVQSDIGVANLRYQIESLQEDVCRIERKLDDLREDITGKKVYRTPCP